MGKTLASKIFWHLVSFQYLTNFISDQPLTNTQIDLQCNTKVHLETLSSNLFNVGCFLTKL